MTTIEVRRGTAIEWATANPILAAGEPGLETDTGKFKLGDGKTVWQGLTYFISETDVDARYGANGAQVAWCVAQRLTGKKIVIIFRHDDLQQSQYSYLQEYAAREIRASFFVTTSFLDSAGHLTTTQLREIYAANHDIGSHSVSHTRFSELDAAGRRWELAESKKWLEKTLGHGYTCEVFAFPGNVNVSSELFDYYIGGLGDDPTPSLYGPHDLSNYPAELADAWIDDTSIEATSMKVRNRLAKLKSSGDGTAVAVIQAHNESEMSHSQLGAMLDICLADEDVIILTVREWLHYLRNYYRTLNGQQYFQGSRSERNVIEWNSSNASSGALVADRRGKGAAFRVLVNGVEVGRLDDHLFLTGSTSQSYLEKGHAVNQYSPDNKKRVKCYVTDGGLMMFEGTGMSYLRTSGFGVRAQRDHDAVQAYSADGTERFSVNTTRGTAWLPNLGALPTGTSRVGEFCIVNGVLMICTVGGYPGTWISVGSQA